MNHIIFIEPISKNKKSNDYYQEELVKINKSAVKATPHYELKFKKALTDLLNN